MQVTVMGTGFTSGMVVQLNGSQALITSFVSANELQATIPNVALASPSLLQLTVTNATGTAIVAVYSLSPPSITGVSPAAVPSKSTASLTFTGANLIGSNLGMGSPDIQVQSESGTDSSLTFSISIGSSATLGSHTVTLSKPNGGSAAFAIQIVDGGSWQTLNIPNATGRVNASVTTLLDGRILIAGGSNSQPVASAGFIDPTNFAWIDAPPMNIPRSGHQSVLLSDGRVMVFGGQSIGGATSSVEIYDPVANSWTIAGFVRNTSASPILIPSGKVLLLPNEVYDPSAQTSMSVNGSLQAAAGKLNQDGTVYVTNGTSAAIYDPIADLARSVAQIPGTLSNPTASPILMPDGRIFITITLQGLAIKAVRMLYDPVANAYTPLNITTIGTAVVLSTGKVLVLWRRDTGAGVGGRFTFVPEAWTFDFSTNMINTAAPPPQLEAISKIISLNDGRLFVYWTNTLGIYTPETTTYPAPVTSSVSVFSTNANGDTTVKITGSRFLPNSQATFGTTVLRTLYVGANALFAFIPAALQSQNPNGMITVTNAGPGGGSSTPLPVDTSVQPPPPAPTITGITPAMGPQGAAVAATITGTNLSGVTAMTFSGTGLTGVLVAAPNLSPNQIPLMVVIAQDAPPGPRGLKIATSAGTATLNAAFTVQRANESFAAPQPIPEVEQGVIHSGYVVITPDTNTATPTPTLTFGMVSGGIVQYQAGTFPGPMTTDASLFADVIPGIGRNLGVALANPGGNTNTITLTLSDKNGVAVGTPVTVALQPQQQLARFVTDMFTPDVIGAALQAQLRMQSSTSFATIGLRFSGTNFSTLPVVMNTTSPGVPSKALTSGSTANTPLAGTIGGNAAVILPQFAMGGGWATQIAIVNNSRNTMSGRVDLFDTSGNPMAMAMNGATQSTFTYSVPPDGVFLLAPRDANGQSPF